MTSPTPRRVDIPWMVYLALGLLLSSACWGWRRQEGDRRDDDRGERHERHDDRGGERHEESH